MLGHVHGEGGSPHKEKFNFIIVDGVSGCQRPLTSTEQLSTSAASALASAWALANGEIGGTAVEWTEELGRYSWRGVNGRWAVCGSRVWGLADLGERPFV